MNDREEPMFVPWFSKAEWQLVYEDLYADTLEAQERGLQRLFLWKSRVPRLAAGVECTLHLMYTTLIDKKTVRQRQQTDILQLQLTYGTALTRFINLISHLGQDLAYHQNLQKVVQNIGIPDWLVSLRHEAVHGSLPSLELLRSAAQIALNWLKDNYWKAEEHRTRDYVIEEKAISIKSPTKTKVVNVNHQKTKEILALLIDTYLAVQELKDPNRQQLVHFKDQKAIKTIAELLEALGKTNEVQNLSTKAASKLLLNEVRRLIGQGSEPGTLSDTLIRSRILYRPVTTQDYESTIAEHWDSFCPFFRMLQQSKALVHFIKSLIQDIDRNPDAAYAVAWLAYLCLQIKIVNEKGANPTTLLATDFEKHYDWSSLARWLLLRNSSYQAFQCAALLLSFKSDSSSHSAHESQLQELMTIMAMTPDQKAPISVRDEPERPIYGLESLETGKPVTWKANLAPCEATPIVLEPNALLPQEAGMWTTCFEHGDWSSVPLGCTPGIFYPVFPDWTEINWQETTST